MTKVRQSIQDERPSKTMTTMHIDYTPSHFPEEPMAIFLGNHTLKKGRKSNILWTVGHTVLDGSDLHCCYSPVKVGTQGCQVINEVLARFGS